MSSNFAVDGSPFPVEPKSASISFMDLDGESERNANGILVRQIIRSDVRKIEIEFGPITASEAATILNMLNKPKFSFSFPDPSGGPGYISGAYCGDRQLGYLRTNYNGSIARRASAQTASEEGVAFNGARSDSGGTLYDGLRVSIIEY